MLLKVIKTSTKEGTSADLSRSAFSNLGKEINFVNKRFRKNTKGRLIQLELVKSRILIEFFSSGKGGGEGEGGGGGTLIPHRGFPSLFSSKKKKKKKKLGVQGIGEALFARSERPIVLIRWLSFTR